MECPLSPPAVDPGVTISEPDFLDYDTVELYDEDFHDITTLLKLSDTARDKLTFTVAKLHRRERERDRLLMIIRAVICPILKGNPRLSQLLFLPFN